MSHVFRLAMFCLALFCSQAPLQANDPPLPERITHLKVSKLELRDATVAETFELLAETLRRGQDTKDISVVLVALKAIDVKIRISETFRDKPLKEVIERLCTGAGMNYALDHHTLIVGPKGSSLSTGSVRVGEVRSEEFRESGMRVVLPKITWSGTGCSTAVSEVQRAADKYNSTGKTFSVRLRLRDGTIEPQVHAWLRNAIAGEAVAYICLSAGLVYSSPQEGVYLIEQK